MVNRKSKNWGNYKPKKIIFENNSNKDSDSWNNNSKEKILNYQKELDNCKISCISPERKKIKVKLKSNNIKRKSNILEPHPMEIINSLPNNTSPINKIQFS